MDEGLPEQLGGSVLNHLGAHGPGMRTLMVATTATATVLVLATLPAVAPDGLSTLIAAAVVAGAVASTLAYLGLPRMAWMPFVPAAVVIAAVMATTGGSASPYVPLLLVLLIGGATLPRRADVLTVALLVLAAMLSPLLYEPPRDYATATTAIEAGSAMLATVIVARVSAAARAARTRIIERTRLVSAVLNSLPQQAAVVNASGRIVLTNAAWDRIHALAGVPPDSFTAGADYATACTSRDGAIVVGHGDLVQDLDRVLDGRSPMAISELSWELLVGAEHRFTIRTTALPDQLGAVITLEDVTQLLQSKRSRRQDFEQLPETRTAPRGG